MSGREKTARREVTEMKRIYEWDKWFRLRKFALRMGVHFDCSPSSIAQQIRNQAALRGVKASITQPRSDILVVTIKRK